MSPRAFAALTLLLVGTPVLTGFAFDGDGQTQDAIVSTSSAVAGVSGGGVLAVLWMFLRKVDAFFTRIQAHFDAEERLLGSIVGYVDSLKLERVIDEKAEERARKLTPEPQPVEHYREQIASRDNLRDVIGKGRVTR